ncbi:MAG TPA: hypothetical protein VLI69_08255, partial [Gammaproteobacteria bacterium]|nr:hypothetical protein [Gammaproteobacteria bacterium]
HKQLCPFMTLGEQETFRKWVNTLLRRDQGLVLQQEKACIRYVYGLGPDEYLESTIEKNHEKTMECKIQC